MTAARRRLIATELCEHFDVSQRRVVPGVGPAPVQPPLRARRAATSRRRWPGGSRSWPARHPRFGYRRIWVLLDREGWSVNKKAVRRHLATARG